MTLLVSHGAALKEKPHSGAPAHRHPHQQGTSADLAAALPQALCRCLSAKPDVLLWYSCYKTWRLFVPGCVDEQLLQRYHTPVKIPRPRHVPTEQTQLPSA